MKKRGKGDGKGGERKRERERASPHNKLLSNGVENILWQGKTDECIYAAQVCAMKLYFKQLMISNSCSGCVVAESEECHGLLA